MSSYGGFTARTIARFAVADSPNPDTVSEPGERVARRQDLSRADRRLILAGCLLSLLFGLLYVGVTPPGTPYDEPAHFGNVLSYAQTGHLPVLGHPGVTYEAQMGPVYYVCTAVISSISRIVGTPAMFYTLRILGLLLFMQLQILTYRFVKETLPGRGILPFASMIFMGLCPSLLAIAASIQNDLLALVFCSWAMLLMWRWYRDDVPPVRYGLGLGLVVSLAVLTKLSTAFLIPGLALIMLLKYRARSIRFLITYTVTIVVATGWWFVRNLVLYGDLTASAGLRRFGYHNLAGPFQLNSPHVILTFIRDAIGTYWLPNGYYRGMFHSSLPVIALIAVMMGASAFGVISAVIAAWRAPYLRSHRDSAAWMYFACLAGACILFFSGMAFRIGAVSIRTTFPIFFLFALAVNEGGLRFVRSLRLNDRVWLAGMVAAFAVINVDMLVQVHDHAQMAFNHMFG